MTRIETAHEYEMAVNHLVDKLRAWLVQQPEWPVVFMSDRTNRRRAARTLVREVMTIPVRQYEPGEVNRKLRRQFIRDLVHAERAWYKGVTL